MNTESISTKRLLAAKELHLSACGWCDLPAVVKGLEVGA
jgi:hypothetical protein